MRKALTSNLALKALAVLVACIIWVFVANVDDPERKVSYEVDVEIRNSDSFGVDKTFSVEDDTDKVKVWVKARESVLNSLKARDLTVVADMRNVTLGNAVPYTIECKNSAITKANLECEPSSMKIKVEDIVQESFAVEVNAEGAPADGYVIGVASIAEGDTIDIAGAESLVSIIHKVSVTVDVNGLSDSSTIAGEIGITDRNGTAFTKNQIDNLVFTTQNGELITDKQLNARVEFWRVKKNIRLEVETSGEPAIGCYVSKVRVTPQTINLAGDEETLKEIGGILTLSDVISVEGVSKSFTTDAINIADYLQEKYKGRLKLEDGAASTVSAKVTIMKMGTKKIEIPVVKIKMIHRPENMDMVLTPADKITVEVGAQKGTVGEIDEADVQAEMDLSTCQKPGRYEVPVKITVPDGYRVDPNVSMIVNLTPQNESEETDIITVE